MNHHLKGAKLIGYNEMGHVCVWSGGYSFSVYDAAGDWSEVRHFTSGRMVDYSDKSLAKARMQQEGFTLVD